MDRSFSKKCILIRHGQTKGNVERRFIGAKSDVDLTDEGIRMAKEAAKRVPDLNLKGDEYFFVSPLKRAVMTADILFPGAKLIKKDAFVEIDFGRFEGKNHEELDGDPKYQAWIDSGGADDFPEGDNKLNYAKKVTKGFYEACEESGDKDMIIVCHMGTMMALISSLTGEDYFNIKADNLEGYVLTFTYNKRITDLSYDRFSFGSLS